MPTTSSYYADLEYPTVNEDASTYGTIINTYLDGLLTKLKTISDRVTNSQAQLGNINRGTNAVDRINNTLAGSIGSSALLPSTGTTLLPDPYSGTYTKTTSWPAFTSELSSYSPPTTQSEVENFDYQGFAAALQTEVDRIEATVTQAEADILQARKDTCRTKKYIDAYNSRSTTKVWTTNNTITVLFQMTSAVSGSAGTSASFSAGVPSSYSSQWASLLTAGYATDQATTTYWNWRGGGPTYTPPVNNYNVGDTVLGVYINFLGHGNMTIGYDSQGLVNATFTGSWYQNFSQSAGYGFTVEFSTLSLVEQTSFPSVDLSPCENPNPASIPYFP